MTERAVLEAAAAARARSEPYLIATVAAVIGSAYRRPGARMLLTQHGWVAGSVSGGCLEGDIVDKGWWRTEQTAALVTYDSTVDDDDDRDEVRAGLGLGCNGIVEVLLERAGTSEIDPLAFIAECRARQQCGALVTVFRSDDPAIAVGARAAIDAGGRRRGHPVLVSAAIDPHTTSSRWLATPGGRVQVLIEAIAPPMRLFVLGAGHDAVPVVQLARTVGWEVIVCAPHARPSLRERFACADQLLFGAPDQIAATIASSHHASAIVMNHHYERDSEHLAMLLGSSARYIGVLGPRHRTVRMLGEHGRTLGDDLRVHAPVGLALGAEAPAEIALAIVSEVQAELAASDATPLRDHAGPIHAQTLDVEADRVVAFAPRSCDIQ